MQQLSDVLRLGLRPPPTNHVVQQFKNFVSYRAEAAESTTDLHIEYALKTFQYLQSIGREGRSPLDVDTLGKAMRAVAKQLPATRGFDPGRGNKNERYKRSLHLAQLLYAELAARKDEAAGTAFDFVQDVPHLYTRIISERGPPAQSLEFILELLEESDQHRQHRPIWRNALKCAARTGQDAPIVRVLGLMAKYNIPYDESAQVTIIKQFIDQDDFDAVKRWYLRPLRPVDTQGAPPKASTGLVTQAATDVFWLCLQRGDLEFAAQIVHSLMAKADTNQVPNGRDWMLIFAWGAVNKKSVAELQEMMNVMRARCERTNTPFTIKMSTFNALIKVAIMRDDTYMAEKYLAMATSMQCQPDYNTHILMMDHRLKHADIEGALDAYHALQKVVLPVDNPDIKAANRLVLAMLQQPTPHKSMFDIVMDLVDRHARLEPPVVTALSMFHLHKDELHDAIDLIRTHAWQFTTDERASIKNEIADFCMNPDVGPEQAWDSYVVLNELFEHETSRGSRQQIMSKLFQQGRPDLAVHVFGHLRQSHLPERRPTNESYTMCFEGIAATGGDQEIFQIVHNMLKLDHNVDPDTRIYNAIMLVHIAAGNSTEAFYVWEDVALSREGPTYNSFRIALVATEEGFVGLEAAKAIWEKVHESQVALTPDLYISYAWALARLGALDEALSLLEEMARKLKQSPNAAGLAVLWNVSREPGEKASVAKWAQLHHPQIWSEVEALPTRKTDGLIQEKAYDVPRGLRA